MIRIVGVLALALGVCLVAVPVALADSPQDYPSVTQAETTAPDWLERQAATQAEVVVRPDDQPGVRGPGIVPTEPVVFVAVEDGGFDWTDAAIGGAVVLGVALLAGLAAWTATRHGPTPGRHAPR
jgi:hypothetical protein